MRLAIDTNVILDVMQRREPFFTDSAAIFDAISNRTHVGAISANTMTDIYYMMRKYMTKDDLRSALRQLMSLMQIISVGSRDCDDALDTGMDDYEDSLLAVCAQKWGADLIITRDVDDFAHSPVRALTPTDFLFTY